MTGRAMTVWQEATRGDLAEILPEALVVLPLGATEQHGPHLPTCTDALIVQNVCESACRLAAPACCRPLVLAPVVPFGASDHHLAFGATLSLSAETLLAVVVDLTRSIARSGGRRLALVNGHGGNRGVAAAAAAAAAARFDIAVAWTDYWASWQPTGTHPPWPGHAGRFESSLMKALRPDLVGQAQRRDPIPSVRHADGWDLHTEQLWRDIDGYTDQPDAALAADGSVWLESITAALADRLTELARCL